MLSPTRRKGTASKGRRNLILFGIILAGLTALIVFVSISTRAPKPIMPPEPPEMMAKRQSPDNAFYIIWEAARSLPNGPGPAFIHPESNPKATEPYLAKPGSLGTLLQIDRPDDDEALLFYLFACQPAIQKTREGLKKEYFLYPHIGTPETTCFLDEAFFWGVYARLGGVLTACMLVNAQKPEQEQQSLTLLSDTLRLSEWLGGDGGIQHYSVAASMMESVLRRVPDAAAAITSSDVLRAMRDTVSATTLHESPAQPYLEFTWRTIDNWNTEGGPQFGGPGPDVVDMIHNLYASWVFTRHCRRLRNDKEQLLSIAGLSYPEFIRRRDAGTLPEDGWMFAFGGLGDTQMLIATRTELRTIRAGALIALNLELYRRDHGHYPDTLDALVPDYLDALPTGSSHITEEPFIYQRGRELHQTEQQELVQQDVGGDYWLYPGPERDNLDDLNERAKRQAVIHCPPEKEQ